MMSRVVGALGAGGHSHPVARGGVRTFPLICAPRYAGETSLTHAPTKSEGAGHSSSNAVKRIVNMFGVARGGLLYELG